MARRAQLDFDLDGADAKGRVNASSEKSRRMGSYPPPTMWATSDNEHSGSSAQHSHARRRRNKSESNSGAYALPWEEGSALMSPSCTTTSRISSSSNISVDPFNLITFFPTPTQMRSEEGSAFGGGSSGGGEWDWLSEDSSVNNEEYDGEWDYESKEEEVLIESEDKIRRVGFTDVAGQVIDGEDKFGMLELSGGKIAKILLGDIGSLLGRLAGVGVVNDGRDYGPEDMEEVC